MQTTIEKIQTIFQKNGVSIYGICDEKLVTIRRGNRPSDLMPTAASVITFGVPFPRGIYQCKKHMPIAYWRNSNHYFVKIDTIMLEVATAIEEDGYIALPINVCFPLIHDFKGEYLGLTSVMHMAEAAKIGKIGKNGLLFSSRYGPRLLLGGVITDAPLPAITMPGPDEQGCPEDCFVCQANCPAGAIDKNGNVDIYKCTKHAARSPMSFYNIPFAFLYRVIHPISRRVMLPVLFKLGLLKKDALLPERYQQLINVKYSNDHFIFNCIDCVAKCPYVADAPDQAVA